MSGRDGRDDADAFESTDWLLAQLGQGRRPDLEGHDAPPVAEPAAEAPAEQIAPPPAEPEPAEPEPAEPRARRSEETLDWFSLAEPAPTSDAATRELPVVGEPIEPREQTAPLQPASPQSAPPAAPEWTSPYGVRPPAVPPQSPPPPAEPPSRLTSVEPPVGTGAVAPLPPVFPPVPPAEPPAAPPAPPAEPPAGSPPPGPVTPPASFALTWGEPQIDSEAGLRAAFRQLSEPSVPAEPEPPLPDGVRDSNAPSFPQPQAPAPVPPAPTPPAPAAQPDDEPFESFTRPPVAPDFSAPVPPLSPPPPSAPPSWDDLAAAAAARSGQVDRPAHDEPQPPTAPGHSGDYADELWSAMHDSESQPPAPEQAAPAEVPPSATTPAFEAFGAFAAFGTEPVEPQSQPEPEPKPEPSAEPGIPQVEPPFQAEPQQAEPRGRFAAFADDAFEASVVPPPAFGAPPAPPTRRPIEPTPAEAELPPHQAFTPAPFGNPTAFGGPAPVDDLLAALGGGLAAGQGDRGTFGQSVSEEVDDSARRPLPPMTGPIPSGFSELGLALGAASSYSRHDDEPDEDEDQSSIARQIAETGYFWNLTPDPGGFDPKAPVEEAASAADRTPGAPAPEPEEELELEFEPEPEPFDPFAAVRHGADPAAPDTDPFGLRQVFGDERDPSAARAAHAASPADADTHAESSPTAALPAARPNGADHDPLASIFGAGPSVVDATFPATQADPWATAGHDAAGRGPANGAATAAGAAGAAAFAAGGSGSGGAGGPAGAGRGPSGPGVSTASGSSGGGRRSPLKVLAWIAGGLVAVLVLVGLFFLGTQLTGGAQDAASESPSPSETTPEAAPEPTAPQPVGVHAWDTLFGGECLDPFTDPWAEEFTVVDCAAPHAAQLVYRGVLPGDAAAPFPGETALAEQMPALCSAAGVIDLGAAGGLNDLQVQGTFPVTEEQWADGERTYYCFANRSSGEPLTASIQGPGPAV